MENLTLTVAAVGAVLVMFLPPVYALAVYIAVLVLYPTYLMVIVGGINISAARIVIAVLTLKCILDIDIKKNFKWCELDTWVSISMIVYVGMMFVTRPFGETFQNRAGYLMDTWLAYIVTRLCITDRTAMLKVIKAIGLILIPMAVLGIIESWVGWQPYLPLTRFCPWQQEVRLAEPRSGLNRAIGPFGHPIMFGICFALFLPLVYSLRNDRSYWHLLAYLVSGIIIFGAVSSMSSGPIMMVVSVIVFLFMERYKQWVKPLLYLSVIMCVMIGIVSNRPFYHVFLSNLDPTGGSWWHRAKLIDLAREHFSEWYLLGYGGKDPGWGEYLGSNHTDITNEFILAGVQYGILGILALCSVLVVIFLNLIRLYNSAADAQTKSLVWALGSSIAATVIVFMSVSFFGQMITLLYCVFGMIGSATCIAGYKVPGRNSVPVHQSGDAGNFEYSADWKL
jgi:hypothetical protein